MDIKFSNKVKIRPWIGNEYHETKPKILVLGMATYPEKYDKNVVIKIVKSLINKKRKEHHFWKRTFNLLKNDEEKELAEFWERVCIYEYIQELLPPKVKPTKENWQNAQDPFEEVLNKLKPDIVAVLGFSTYDNLKINGEKCLSLKFNNEKMEILKYKKNKKIIYFCRIKHTAAYGYIKNVWRNLFLKFLENIKNNKI